MKHMSDFIEKLKKAIQPPCFSSFPVMKMQGQEIVEQLRPILRQRISKTNYDRVAIATRFLRHYIRQFKRNNMSPLEALSSFFVKSSLFNNGNSCVGLSLDLLQHLPKKIKGYPVAAVLAKHYQQFAGPLYSHVAALISFQDPNNNEKNGFVLLDPSFHIAEPILLFKNGPSIAIDMGEKKGVWTFSLEGNEIFCRAVPKQPSTSWSDEKIKDATMIYRTDRFCNPETGYAIHQLPIDKSLPIVSRKEDGEQKAHINIDLSKKEVIWKVGNSKKESITFADLLQGKITFNKDLYLLLGFSKKKFLNMIIAIIKNKAIFDDLYSDYLKLLQQYSFFSKNLRHPHEIRTRRI